MQQGTKDARYWIEALNLQAHPEGGYFRETYRAEEAIGQGALPERYTGSRAIATGIYFLLPGNHVSRFHRLASDEQWHFYAGSSVTVHCIAPTGEYTAICFGADVEQGQVFQGVIAAGTWFGATVDDPALYSLVGCTVAPGFDFDDFELASRSNLLHWFPEHREIIEQLTPAG